MTDFDQSPENIPTLSDIVKPGDHRERQQTRTRASDTPTASPDVADEIQLSMPLDADADELPAPVSEADLFAEDCLPAPGLDPEALLAALEPRIEALVDEALQAQVRAARDEIVSSVMAALRDQLGESDA